MNPTSNYVIAFPKERCGNYFNFEGFNTNKLNIYLGFPEERNYNFEYILLSNFDINDTIKNLFDQTLKNSYNSTETLFSDTNLIMGYEMIKAALREGIAIDYKTWKM